MKIYIFAIAFFCIQFGILTPDSTFAQGFNSVSSSNGVNVTAVGNSGKLYRSVNGGVTWAGYINGTVNMNCVVSFSSDVWIAANHGTVYKTSNVDSPILTYSIGNTTNLNSIAFVFPNTLYVCGDGGLVSRSDDGGISWTSSNSGIANVKLNSISFINASNGIVVGNNGSIYLTSDGGASWELQSSVTTNNLLKVKYFADGYVAAGEYGSLVVKNFFGVEAINTRIKTDIRGVTGNSMTDVHVCGGGGFIRNNKNGSDKFLNFEQNPMMANLVDIFYYENKGWAVSSLNSVIIYTQDGGATWSMSQGSTVSRNWVSKLSPTNAGRGNTLCEHPFNRDAMFVVYGNTVYRSGNRGDNWTNIGTIPGGTLAHSFYVSPLDTNIWMVAITSSTDKIKRTTNYGATWTDIISDDFSNYGQPLEMDQNNPSNYYFAPDDGGFYRSTDNGASFTEISGNYPFRSPCDIIVMWDSSEVIYIGDGVTGSGQSIIFKSTNNGVNWTNMIATVSSEVPSMCNTAFDQSIAYATNWSGGQLYKTTNFGANWFLHSTQNTSGWGSDYCHEDPTMLLKGTYGSPTYLTTNSGVSFISNAIGGSQGAGIIVPEKGYLIAMQTNGLLKMEMTYNDSIINQTQTNGVMDEKFTSGFVPSGWQLETTSPTSGTNYWIYSDQSGYDVGTGSAEYNFWDAPDGRNQSMITKSFTPSGVGDSLAFDYAYAPYNTTSVDSLIIETSTNGGTSYTRLMKLYGKQNYNGDSTLNTRGQLGSEFNNPTSSEWRTKKYLLPEGTNKLKFRARSGFGNNLFIDNINVNSKTSTNATQVNIKLAIEGFYNGVNKNLSDTITVYLRNAVTPFAKVDSSRTVVDANSFIANCQFANAPTGAYYFQIIHRNALETWSRYGGEYLVNGSVSSYDFTISPGQGYGSNLDLKDSKWCLFSGDVNRDGSMDVLDLSLCDDAAFNFVSGYVATDLNGDGTVDATDLAIIDFNSFNFVSKITPENAPTLSAIEKIKTEQINLSTEKKRSINSKSFDQGILTK